MLYDVAAHTGQPVANPLPVRLLRFYSGPGAPPEAAAPAGDAHGSHRFDFLAPSVILDRTAQTVYRLALNLPAVVESCSDAAVLAGFLQRRRGGPTPAMALAAPPPGGAPPPGSEVAAALAAALAAVQPKALLLGVVRNALQERMPMATVRAVAVLGTCRSCQGSCGAGSESCSMERIIQASSLREQQGPARAWHEHGTERSHLASYHERRLYHSFPSCVCPLEPGPRHL